MQAFFLQFFFNGPQATLFGNAARLGMIVPCAQVVVHHGLLAIFRTGIRTKTKHDRHRNRPLDLGCGARENLSGVIVKPRIVCCGGGGSRGGGGGGDQGAKAGGGGGVRGGV
jgi:hypothetical protein